MRHPFVQLHIAVFLAGFTAILGKLILLNEGLLVWYRLLLTVLLLCIMQGIKKEFIFLSWKNTVNIFLVGFIIAIHWVSFYGSVKYANVSVALTCFSSIGFFTAFFEPLLLKKKMDWTEVAIGLLAIVGIYIIFDFHPQYKTGIVFGVVSAISCSLFSIYNKILLRQFLPQTIMFYEMAGGLLALTFLIPFYLIKFPAGYYWPTNSDWLWLVVLASICTIVAFHLQLNALKKISAFTVNLSYNLEPVYGILMAFAIFHENKKLGGQFYIGLSLIILAVVFQMLRMTKKAPLTAA